MPRMRAPRTGTIDLRGDRWRIRITLPDGTRKPFYTDPNATREEAEQLLAALLQELAGTTDDPRIGGRTLGAIGLTWLDERARTHRDWHGDAQRWNAYVVGTSIAGMKLDAITPRDVRRWAKYWLAAPSDRTGRPRDRGTIANALTTLRAAIRWALEEERIDENVGLALLAVELPRGTVEQHVETEETIDALETDELVGVLALGPEALATDARSAFTVGAWSGLRAGELHGLEWSRVDWARREVVVARSRRAAPKNGKVGRSQLLVPAFDALERRWVEAGRPVSGLVWPSTKAVRGGGREVIGCHARGYDWGWSPWRETRKLTTHVRALEQCGALRIVGESAGRGAIVEYPGIRGLAGIARRIDFKSATRHTCASHLLSGTWAPVIVPHAWSLEQVCRQLRHSSIAVTEKHYARFVRGALPTRGLAIASGPGAGPAGPGGANSSSRFPDLNRGPTVYETGLHATGSLRDSAGGTLADAARSVLLAIAAKNGVQAIALAATLAGRILAETGAGEEASVEGRGPAVSRASAGPTEPA